jgi:hypothetical protein
MAPAAQAKIDARLARLERVIQGLVFMHQNPAAHQKLLEEELQNTVGMTGMVATVRREIRSFMEETLKSKY